MFFYISLQYFSLIDVGFMLFYVCPRFKSDPYKKNFTSKLFSDCIKFFIINNIINTYLPTVHIFLKISKRNSPCCSLIPLKSSRVIWRSRRPSRSWKLSTILCVVSESILYSSATYSNHRVNSTDVQLLGCKAAQRGRESTRIEIQTNFLLKYWLDYRA